MPLSQGPPVPVAGVPDGLVAHAAVEQVRDGEDWRDRTDRAGRVVFSRVWLLATGPAVHPVAAAAQLLGERTLAWLVDASTHRSATAVLRKAPEARWHAAAATGTVRLLYELTDDRTRLGRLVRIEVLPACADEVVAWQAGLAAAAHADLARVADAWHGTDLADVIEALRRLDAPARRQAADVLVALAERLPADGTPLTALATAVGVPSHTLDLGSPLGRLTARAAAALAGLNRPNGADAMRAAWDVVGVLVDPWSSNVVAWQLPLVARHPAGRVAAAHGDHPALLSLQVLGEPGSLVEQARRNGRIFVVENASVLAAAVEAGVDAPVLWAGGSVGARRLVHAAVAAGWQVWVSADFEPGGLRRARRLLADAGNAGRPWRLAGTDYDPSLSAETFDGDPGETPWDPSLAEVMRRHRRRVLEEHRLDVLLGDLGA